MNTLEVALSLWLLISPTVSGLINEGYIIGGGEVRPPGKYGWQGKY